MQSNARPELRFDVTQHAFTSFISIAPQLDPRVHSRTASLHQMPALMTRAITIGFAVL